MSNMMFPGMGNGGMPMRAMRVVKLVVMDSGTFNPMYLRPYQTHYDISIEEELLRKLHGNYGQSTSSLMAGIANRFMMPSAQHAGAANIINGWGTKRAKFTMMLEVQMETGTLMYYQLQGYTDHYDLSHGGKIDPRTTFHVNSYVRLSRNQIQGQFGIETRDIVTETAQVIDGRFVKSFLPDTQHVYGLRPNEMYSVLQADVITQKINPYDQHAIFDTRHSLDNMAVPSLRRNNLPCNIISEMVNSYQAGSQQINHGIDSTDKYGRSKTYADDGTFFHNPFFQALSNMIGVPETTYFTLNDLLQLDKNVLDPRVSTFISVKGEGIMQLPRQGDSEVWHNPNSRNTWVATVLANAVPTIMLDLGISRLTFSATNQDFGGRHTVVPMGASDLSGQPLARSLDIFKTRIVTEVLHDASYGGQETYELMMTVDLYGHTEINIRFGSEPMTPYVVPSFCDSLFSPILSYDEQQLRRNAYDFQRVLENINSNEVVTNINPAI